MFNPTEIIFSCTTACNLHCAHCFINREPNHLNAEDAILFLKSAHESQNSSIEKIGFSGGEPFLRTDFLCEVIKAAIDMDFMFDRIMTNGDWWKTEEDLRSTLQRIYDAGYDGKIGLSYDKFHGQSEERISTFIKTVWEFFGNDSVEIQTVKGESLPPAAHSVVPTPPSPRDKPLKPHNCDILTSLSAALNLSYEENISDNGTGIASLSDDEHFLPAYIQKESYQSDDERAFKDNDWFTDDFCEGPGQILFVHADTNIAPCCGFANENSQLFIGTIKDSFDEVLKKASQNKMIKVCYEKGLSKAIKQFEEKGKLPAGKTYDICTFCDYVCKNSSFIV